MQIDSVCYIWMSCREGTSLERGRGNEMPMDSVLCCALQIDSYEAGGRVGVDGTQWAHRARVLDPHTHPHTLVFHPWRCAVKGEVLWQVRCQRLFVAQWPFFGCSQTCSQHRAPTSTPLSGACRCVRVCQINFFQSMQRSLTLRN